MGANAVDSLSDWREAHLAHAANHEPRLLIGGEWRTPHDTSAVTETFDPSTGAAVAKYAVADSADVDAAVRAAADAAPAWAALSPTRRNEHVSRLRELVAENAPLLAALDSINGGMPLKSAQNDVHLSLNQLRDWPGLALALRGESMDLGDGIVHYTNHRPFGVVARIVAFNHPLFFALTGMLPALLAGNAVVLKPAEQAPLSVLALGDALREALPAGVVNIVTGNGRTGEALVTHPDVARIAFTGSTATGLQIQRAAAAGRVRTVSLELGGKNPMIVYPDVDIEASAEGAVKGMSFRGTQGQSCGSTSRIFVHRDVYDRFVSAFAGKLEQLNVGVAYADGTDVGPLVSERQRDRVRKYILDGISEGARLVTGNAEPPTRAPSGGFYVVPTLFGEVSMKMRVAREEIFGPVVCVIPWDDERRLVAEVNALPYGLTASVWTDHLSTALPVVNALQAGYVWVNDAGTHHWGAPFGGFGDSGVGREECLAELQSFTQIQSVHLGAGLTRAQNLSNGE